MNKIIFFFCSGIILFFCSKKSTAGALEFNLEELLNLDLEN